MKFCRLCLAVMFLVALASALTAGWYSYFTDIEGLSTKDAVFLSATGEPITEAKAGDEIRIQRTYTTPSAMSFEFFPTLVSSDGVIYPLPSGVYTSEGGISEKAYGFIVPDIPPGNYTLRTTVNYQEGITNNDRAVVLPVVHLRIIQ